MGIFVNSHFPLSSAVERMEYNESTERHLFFPIFHNLLKQINPEVTINVRDLLQVTQTHAQTVALRWANKRLNM